MHSAILASVVAHPPKLLVAVPGHIGRGRFSTGIEQQPHTTLRIGRFRSPCRSRLAPKRASAGARLMPPVDRRELAAIFLGGAVGALARAALVQLGGGAAPSWPWPTFAANVLGALLLGYFSTRLQERLPLSPYGRPLLGTGLCGALTTFSTVQIELLLMLDAHRYGLAAGYLAASLSAGYAATHIATAATRRVRSLA